MQIILLQNLDKLGKKGDIKNVATGYALNFLFPKDLAAPATDEKIKQFETKKQKINTEKKEQNKEISSLKGKKITIHKKASDQGKLFAAVSKNEIINAIKKDLYINLENNKISIIDQIKNIGEHQIRIKIDGQQITIRVAVNQ